LIFLIDLFESALHVSGDKIANLQFALFDCIYRFWYDAPMLLPALSPFGSNIGALYTKSCIYAQKKVFLKMDEFVARNL
jgi:hypothetical protein